MRDSALLRSLRWTLVAERRRAVRRLLHALLYCLRFSSIMCISRALAALPVLIVHVFDCAAPVPWAVFATPQVAGVGETEEQLQARGAKYGAFHVCLLFASA
jgi:hypothetical protein